VALGSLCGCRLASLTLSESRLARAKITKVLLGEALRLRGGRGGIVQAQQIYFGSLGGWGFDLLCRPLLLLSALLS